MPGLDKTGPMGQGSMTGRKLGSCAGNLSKEEAETLRKGNLMNTDTTDERNDFPLGRGLGRGRGMGRGGRAGRGRGRGMGRMGR